MPPKIAENLVEVYYYAILKGKTNFYVSINIYGEIVLNENKNRIQKKFSLEEIRNIRTKLPITVIKATVTEEEMLEGQA